MSRLPALRPDAVMRALERAGFELVRVRGSHQFYRHRDDPMRATVIPRARGNVPPGTLGEILRQAKLSRDEFMKLL